MHTKPVAASLGPYDPFKRRPSVIVYNGKITFVPGRGATEFQRTWAEFPEGSHLEYRIEKGDMYFNGDHSQALGRTLSAVRPDGTRSLLASGFILYVQLPYAARNLARIGVPLKAVSYFQGKDGNKVETDLVISSSPGISLAAILLGTSSLWLGALAAFFIHDVRYVVSFGVLALCLLGTGTFAFSSSKRNALIKWVSFLPSYGAGYAFSVVVVRHLFR